MCDTHPNTIPLTQAVVLCVWLMMEVKIVGPGVSAEIMKVLALFALLCHCCNTAVSHCCTIGCVHIAVTLLFHCCTIGCVHIAVPLLCILSVAANRLKVIKLAIFALDLGYTFPHTAHLSHPPTYNHLQCISQFLQRFSCKSSLKLAIFMYDT